MPLALLVLAILVSLGSLIDFLVGQRGDRKLRDQLANFYVALEEGDWTSLYRFPAKALLRFMAYVFGDRPFSARFILASVILSIAMTSLFFSLSMVWSYVHSALTETSCPLPDLSQFVQIPAFMAEFLAYVVAISILFDYFSWFVTQRGLGILSTGQKYVPLMAVVGFSIIGCGILWLLYAIYLPLSIKTEANMIGIPFGWKAYLQIFRANFMTVPRLFSLPSNLFHIECADRAHPIFSISFISTMQIVATETVIPMVLLLVSSVFGVLAYLTRSFTRRPVSFLVERIDSSQKPIFALLAGVLWVVSILLSAITSYQKG